MRSSEIDSLSDGRPGRYRGRRSPAYAPSMQSPLQASKYCVTCGNGLVAAAAMRRARSAAVQSNAANQTQFDEGCVAGVNLSPKG